MDFWTDPDNLACIEKDACERLKAAAPALVPPEKVAASEDRGNGEGGPILQIGEMLQRIVGNDVFRTIKGRHSYVVVT